MFTSKSGLNFQNSPIKSSNKCKETFHFRKLVHFRNKISHKSLNTLYMLFWNFIEFSKYCLIIYDLRHQIIITWYNNIVMSVFKCWIKMVVTHLDCSHSHMVTTNFIQFRFPPQGQSGLNKKCLYLFYPIFESYLKSKSFPANFKFSFKKDLNFLQNGEKIFLKILMLNDFFYQRILRIMVVKWFKRCEPKVPEDPAFSTGGRPIFKCKYLFFRVS